MKIPSIKNRNKRKQGVRQPNAGRPNSSVYNYRSSRNESSRQYDRGEELQKKWRLSARRFGGFSLMAAAIICAVYLLTLTPEAKITYKAQSIIERPHNAYQTEINNYLRQSLFNYSKITFDNQELTSQIKAKFPEISEAYVALPLFNRQPKITITFAKATVKLQAHGNDNFILDEQGRALAKESEVASSFDISNLTVLNDTSDQRIEIGQTVLTEQQLEFIRQTTEYAQQKKLMVEAISLSGGASQINVKYTGLDYYVKYSFFNDPRQSSGAYFATVDQLKRDKTTPKEYIDLRIPDRAYIK